MTEKIKREECRIGIYPCCIEFENGKVIRNCYACIEKYGYAKGVYAENQKNKKAWEEVIEELENEINLYENSKSIMGGNDFDIECDGAMRGLAKAIDIINQKLHEIDERN